MCPIFSGAGKFCLTHRLGQITRDVKSNVRTIIFRSDVIVAPPRKTTNEARKRSSKIKQMTNDK